MKRDAVIPLIFNPDLETKSEIEGTAFLVWFQNRTFLITARHCAEHRLRQGWIPTFASEPIPIKIDHLFAPNHLTGEEDDSRSDLAVFEIDESQNSHSPILRLPRISLDQRSPEGFGLSPGDDVLVIGFPYQATEEPADYVIMSNEVCFKAAIDSEYQSCEWKLTFDPQTMPYELQNMSGSPVFRISCAENRWDIVGMQTRGQRASGVAFFIDVAILRWALNDICGQV